MAHKWIIYSVKFAQLPGGSIMAQRAAMTWYIWPREGWGCTIIVDTPLYRSPNKPFYMLCVKSWNLFQQMPSLLQSYYTRTIVGSQ